MNIDKMTTKLQNILNEVMVEFKPKTILVLILAYYLNIYYLIKY